MTSPSYPSTRAEEAFAKAKKATQKKSEADSAAVAQKTARLKALRLAKEQAEDGAIPVGKLNAGNDG
jgi:hypothetical protein